MNCECPICFDAIEGDKNKVITECGHCFHTNCLMTSVAHNGFGCPYCRTEMAQEVNEIDESEYDDDEEEEELYDDDVLRGFRLFMANIEDEEHDEEDIIQEQHEEHLREAAEEREREHELDNGLTPEYVAQRLVLQGVGMIDLVKVLLLGHDEFERRNEEFDRLDGEMFGKLRMIISNYQQ
jgi:hypothetical protein